MKLASSKIANNFYKIFKPELSPKKMLELGVFGGSYFDGKIREYPKSWFKNAKLSKTFDTEQNRFKIKAGLSRKEWIDKGWIFKEDPLGWFQWYCRFKNGRRISRIDEIQIKRWKAFRRHVIAIKKTVTQVIFIVEKDKDKLFYSGLIILLFKWLYHLFW